MPIIGVHTRANQICVRRACGRPALCYIGEPTSTDFQVVFSVHQRHFNLYTITVAFFAACRHDLVVLGQVTVMYIHDSRLNIFIQQDNPWVNQLMSLAKQKCGADK